VPVAVVIDPAGTITRSPLVVPNLYAESWTYRRVNMATSA